MLRAVNLGEPLGRRGGDQRTPFSLDGHERGAVLIDPVLAPLGVSGPVRTVELERIETLVDRGKTGVAEQVAERRLRQPKRAPSELHFAASFSSVDAEVAYVIEDQFELVGPESLLGESRLLEVCRAPFGGDHPSALEGELDAVITFEASEVEDTKVLI